MSRQVLAKAGEVSVASFSDSLKPVEKGSATTVGRIRSSRIRESATSILAAAKEQGFIEGREDGYRQGFEQGLAAGAEEGRSAAEAEARQALSAELKTLKERFEAAIEQIDGAMADWYVRAEREMELLVLEAAEKVLAQELATSRESLLDTARRAISLVTHSASARLRVNPFDCEAATKYKDEILACAGSVRRLEIVEDPTILGGCIIDTDGGLIDASFGGQIDALGDALEDAA